MFSSNTDPWALKFDFITTNIGHCCVAVLSIQVFFDARNRHSVSVGDGMQGIEPEFVLVRVEEKGVLAIAVDAGLAMVEEIGVGRFFDQVFYPNDTVLELVIELSAVVEAVEQGNLVGAASIKDTVFKARFQGVKRIVVTNRVETNGIAHAQSLAVHAVAGGGAVGEVLLAAVLPIARRSRYWYETGSFLR